MKTNMKGNKKMNYKSYIDDVLKLKPIINKKDNSIFFYNDDKDDYKVINDALKSSLVNNFWTWTIEDGVDVLSNGFWLINRNAYVITNYPYRKKKNVGFRMLYKDFKKIGCRLYRNSYWLFFKLS